MATQIKEIQDKILAAFNAVNAKNPYYTLGVFLVALFLADYFLLMQFQLRVLYVLNPKVEILGKELRTTKEDITKMAQYQQDIERLSERVNVLNSKIHSREEIALVIDNIGRLARANKIHVQQILPNSELSEPVLKDTGCPYFSVPLRIEAQATYHDFGRFLNQIEREESFLTIGDFSIQANPMDSTRHAVKLNLNAIVFDPRGN